MAKKPRSTPFLSAADQFRSPCPKEEASEPHPLALGKIERFTGALLAFHLTLQE